MLKLWRNNPNITNVRGPPEHSATGNIHRDILLLGIITLQVYNMSFQTIAGGFNGAFRWYGPLSEDQEFF